MDAVTDLVANTPEVLFSTATLAILAGYLTAMTKPLLRPLKARLWPSSTISSALDAEQAESPWGFVSVFYGVVLSTLAASSSHAPEWLTDPAAVAVYGVALGFIASRGRDALREIAGTSA